MIDGIFDSLMRKVSAFRVPDEALNEDVLFAASEMARIANEGGIEEQIRFLSDVCNWDTDKIEALLKSKKETKTCVLPTTQ